MLIFLVFPHLLTGTLSTLDLSPHPQNNRASKVPSSPEAPTITLIKLTSRRHHNQPRQMSTLPVTAILGLPPPPTLETGRYFISYACLSFYFPLVSFSTLLPYDTASSQQLQYSVHEPATLLADNFRTASVTRT
ncbi:hypothetical protein BC827DRAFT_1225441 [Russula dissimulans]|nr:hypothetical protein BC827DRAFT_1225441 [Russula dissimulans]